MCGISLEEVRKAIERKNYLVRRHARKQMLKRGITLSEIISVIKNGKIIKQKPKAKPFPKCLILGFVRSKKPLYIFCGFDGETAYIITAYWYDLSKKLDLWTKRKIKL